MLIPLHAPVLLNEVLIALQPYSGGVYIDGTVGAGGHAAAILRQAQPEGRLFGLDQDPMALALARQQLAPFGTQVTLIHANFEQLGRLALPQVDGILLDIGVSSMQLDQNERGFSFQTDGPLDMRMNTTTGETAADLVNTLPEDELANLIYQYGEEPRSRRIAKAIVQARPIERTLPLAQLIAKVKPGYSRIHPATQTFQALRIAVNDELGVLARVLPQAIALLKPGGRLAVITFHSLEDRIVKQFFKQESTDCLCPTEQPFCTCQHHATLRLITKKPITAAESEIAVNPRARSAKLRVAELRE